MTLYTTNPQETVSVAETVASRIPTTELVEPVDGAVDVDPRTSIVLAFSAGALTLPIVTVNGIVVYRSASPCFGWHARSRTSGESAILVLTPPVGFAYRSTVVVNIAFEPEAGTDDDGIIILA